MAVDERLWRVVITTVHSPEYDIYTVVDYPLWSKTEPYYLILKPVDTDSEFWVMVKDIVSVSIELVEIADYKTNND